MSKLPTTERALLTRLARIAKLRQDLLDERDELFALGRDEIGTTFQMMADASGVKRVTVQQTLRRRATGKR